MGYSRLSVVRELREPVAAAAHHLRESGLIRVAEAECDLCAPEQLFECHDGAEPEFSCTAYEFICQWQGAFTCSLGSLFDCETQFECQPASAYADVH